VLIFKLKQELLRQPIQKLTLSLEVTDHTLVVERSFLLFLVLA